MLKSILKYALILVCGLLCCAGLVFLYRSAFSVVLGEETLVRPAVRDLAPYLSLCAPAVLLLSCFCSVLSLSRETRPRLSAQLTSVALHFITSLFLLPLVFRFSPPPGPAAPSPPETRIRVSPGVFRPEGAGTLGHSPVLRYFTSADPPRGFVLDLQSPPEIRVLTFEGPAAPADTGPFSDPLVSSRLQIPRWMEALCRSWQTFVSRLAAAWEKGIASWVCAAAMWVPLGALSFATHVNRTRLRNTVRLYLTAAAVLAGNAAWYETSLGEKFAPVGEALFSVLGAGGVPALMNSAPFLPLAVVNLLAGGAVLFVSLAQAAARAEEEFPE